MITGFRFKDEHGDTWWEERRWFESYYWMFKEKEGTRCCMVITYTPR